MAGMQPIPAGPKVMHSEYATHNSWCLGPVFRAHAVLHSRTHGSVVKEKLNRGRD